MSFLLNWLKLALNWTETDPPWVLGPLDTAGVTRAVHCRSDGRQRASLVNSASTETLSFFLSSLFDPVPLFSLATATRDTTERSTPATSSCATEEERHRRPPGPSPAPRAGLASAQFRRLALGGALYRQRRTRSSSSASTTGGRSGPAAGLNDKSPKQAPPLFGVVEARLLGYEPAHLRCLGGDPSVVVASN